MHHAPRDKISRFLFSRTVLTHKKHEILYLAKISCYTVCSISLVLRLVTEKISLFLFLRLTCKVRENESTTKISMYSVKLQRKAPSVADTISTGVVETDRGCTVEIVEVPVESVQRDIIVNTIYTTYSARMSLEITHKHMGFCMEVLILGVIL